MSLAASWASEPSDRASGSKTPTDPRRALAVRARLPRPWAVAVQVRQGLAPPGHYTIVTQHAIQGDVTALRSAKGQGRAICAERYEVTAGGSGPPSAGTRAGPDR